jgi:uncharacterized protein YgbK (DUF1537 family)
LRGAAAVSARIKSELLAGLPDEWPEDVLPEIRRRVQDRHQKVMVLDDDPTGAQTAHDLPVLTGWSVEALQAEMESSYPAAFVLTNTRSLAPDRACALNAEVGHNLAEAAGRSGRDLAVVSRSDSTLRGHFPGEVEALARALGAEFDAWLIVPFFAEGGRITIGDVHYAAEQRDAREWLVPVGETEYARDAAFGYRASNLCRWIAEKTGERIPASSVATITIEDVRLGGPRRVAERLAGLARGSVCIANAASYRDVEVLVLGLLDAEARGRRFLCRTAASFVRARAGIGPRPLLTRTELDPPCGGGGLFVAGSHVTRTTRQIDALLGQPGVAGVEVDVGRLLADGDHRAEVERAATQADRALARGEDAVVFTTRRPVAAGDAGGSLSIGQRVSQGLVDVVRSISTRPRYLLAKGGVTANDLATHALGVQRALVLGQVLPGVPVWRLGPESRHPGLVYIVFPGNVGGPQALVDVATMMQ